MLDNPSLASTGSPHVSTCFEVLLIPTPGTSLTGFTLFLDGLRAANRVSGTQLFKWHIATADGRPVSASNNMPIVANSALAEAPLPGNVAVFASYELSRTAAQGIAGFVRHAARRGTHLIGIDQGAVLLASLGLLDGYQATAHWEVLPSLVERFPSVTFVDELFVQDRDRLTCAGHTACLDLALHIAERQFGRAVALAAASELIYDRIRPSSQLQRLFESTSRHPLSAPVRHALQLMRDHVIDPLPIARVAKQAGVSTRQLECHFQTYLRTPPQRYYLLLRLSQARKLLLYSSMRIGEVSAACGFTSQGSFARAFSSNYKTTPTSYRRRFLDRQDRPYLAHI